MPALRPAKPWLPAWTNGHTVRGSPTFHMRGAKGRATSDAVPMGRPIGWDSRAWVTEPHVCPACSGDGLKASRAAGPLHMAAL